MTMNRTSMMKIMHRILPGIFAIAAGMASAQSQTLTVASYPSADEAIKAAIPIYKKVAPDITIKLVSLSYGDHHSAMTTALATGTGVPDAIAIEVNFLGKLIESGALEDLSKPPYSALSYRDKIVGYTFAQASRKDGVLAAMPADIGPGSLFYRQDLLSKAGVTEAQLTSSWESFIDAGKVIKAKTGAKLVPNASTLSDVYIRTNISAGEGLYFDKNNKPLLTTPRFERAFALAKAVRANGLDNKTTPFTTEWNEGFRRGTFATEMSGAWLAGHLQKYIAPETKGLWRAANLPGGAYASWGGTFYSIPKRISDDRKKMAWDFIKFLATSKEMQIAAFKQLDAYPALLEATKDPFMDAPIEFLGGQKARQTWRVAANNIPAIEVNKFDPVASEIIANELDKVLEGGKDIKLALADAQRLLERRVRR